MKHAVIAAHPNEHSLTLSAARVYVDAVEAAGHTAVLRDLYRMGFDPCLKPAEVPGPLGYHAQPDVLAEQAVLQDADVFTFVYPLWFNAPPAILKGYVERVFDLGFAFKPVFGGLDPLLGGRRMFSISFSGAPEAWLRETHGLDALTLFDRHFAAMSGLQLLGHVHIGGIVPGITPEAAEDIFERIRRETRAALSSIKSEDTPR